MYLSNILEFKIFIFFNSKKTLCHSYYVIFENYLGEIETFPPKFICELSVIQKTDGKN